MADAPKPPKKERCIIYIGDDDSYWDVIAARFKNVYEAQKFKCINFYKNNREKVSYQDIFLGIIDTMPEILYIDLSQNLDFHMRLAQMVARDNSTKNIPVVGLVDSKALLKDCLSAKLSFIHVKCGEIFDVVFDPMRLGFPREVKMPEFAKAKCSHEVEIYDDFRIGYIAPTMLHAEANFFCEEGEDVELFTEISKIMLPSRNFVAKTRSGQNLFYEYRFAYDFEFKFVDEKIDEPAEEAADENLKNLKKQDLAAKHKQAVHQDEVAHVKKKVKLWVLGNVDDTSQKKTKILAIDRRLRILRSAEKPLDQYPFAIRCQSFLSEKMEELDTIRPNLIAFHLDEFREEDHEELNDAKKEEYKQRESQSLATLSQIITCCKEKDKYNPFILLFNCSKYTSKSFQDSYKYPLILVNKEPISLHLVLDMANVYEEKQEKKIEDLIKNKIATLKKENPQKYGRLNAGDFKESRYYIKKSNPLSHAYRTHAIKIIEISESEMVFETTAELVRGSYRLSDPTDMSIAIIPDKDKGTLFTDTRGTKTYQALVHAMGENNKKKLRQFVNEIFFSPLNEKRREEFEKFTQKNQAAYEKKVASQPPSEEVLPEKSNTENASHESSSETRPANPFEDEETE